MSKSLSVVTALEAHKLASAVPFLCLIELNVIDRNTGSIVDTRYIARNPEPVVWFGNTYEAGAFDISLNTEAGKAAEVTLTVVDYSQAIEALMQVNGGGIGSQVTFSVVNAANLLQEPEAQEYFEITGASSADYRSTFVLGADNALTMVFPRRRQRKNFCQWRYKGAECGYTGPLATCDLSLQGPNGCAAHSNTIRFGAFPGINSNGFRYA